ncbi:MAG: hypothetical protein WD993_03850 [Thermoleophilaceae bacterium]
MNPFRYSQPVSVEDLIDRDGEAEELLRNAEAGDNSRLVAPRRYGKTSLVRRLLHDADRLGWATVYVDFFGVLTLADIAERIEIAYAEQLTGPLQSWFAGARQALRPTFTAGGGPVPASVGVSLDAQAEPPLLDRLALPRRLHERKAKRVLVVFDEFQDVLGAKSRADAVIRSEVQHHGDAASYVFAGSHVGMMRELFADKRRAFYGQALPVALPPLSAEDVADYVAGRFLATQRDIGTALGPLLATAHGHPQRTMLLAHCVWDQTPAGETATEETWARAFDRAMNDVQDELRAIWNGLSVSHRRALVGIAENAAGLFAATRAHGGSRGGAVTAAVAALVDAGEVVEDPDTRTGYRPVDPLLAAWIADGRASS